MPRTNANAITTTKVLNITFRERELGQSRIFAKSYEEYARKPERFWENRYLNQIILERLATTTDSAYIYATATDEDGLNPVSEAIGAAMLRKAASTGFLRYAQTRRRVKLAINDFSDAGCVMSALLHLNGFYLRVDWKNTKRWAEKTVDFVVREFQKTCAQCGLVVPTMWETEAGFWALWMSSDGRSASYLPVWRSMMYRLSDIFGNFGVATFRTDVCEQIELPTGGSRLLCVQKQKVSWDVMYNALNALPVKRAYREAWRRAHGKDAQCPAWWMIREMVWNDELAMPGDLMPTDKDKMLPSKPYSRWMESPVFKRTADDDQLPAVVSYTRKPPRARSRETINDAFQKQSYANTAEDFFGLIKLRKGDFTSEMQQRLYFYLYFYTMISTGNRKTDNAPAVAAVERANAMMRYPLPEDKLQEQLKYLRRSVRLCRSAIGSARVISDLQVTETEQKQMQGIMDAEERKRRRNKSGRTQKENDDYRNHSIVRMLYDGLSREQIADKLGLSVSCINYRIRRFKLIQAVDEAKKELERKERELEAAKQQAKKTAKQEDRKHNHDDDFPGSSGTGAGQDGNPSESGQLEGGDTPADAMGKKRGRRPLTEAERVVRLAMQRVRRAKEKLWRKCYAGLRKIEKGRTKAGWIYAGGIRYSVPQTL